MPNLFVVKFEHGVSRGSAHQGGCELHDSHCGQEERGNKVGLQEGESESKQQRRLDRSRREQRRRVVDFLLDEQLLHRVNQRQVSKPDEGKHHGKRGGERTEEHAPAKRAQTREQCERVRMPRAQAERADNQERVHRCPDKQLRPVERERNREREAGKRPEQRVLGCGDEKPLVKRPVDRAE